MEEACAPIAFLDEQGPATQGHFKKFNWSVHHQRHLPSSLSLSADVQAQWASDDLDSSERWLLTEPNTVRSFSPDFLSVDTGITARVQLTVAPRSLDGWSANVYHDAGTGVLRRTPQQGGGNNANVRGIGAGAGCETTHWLAVLTVATRTGGNAPALCTQTKSWTWASISYRF
jgi:hemolysin activation/secretion protein